MRIVLANWVYGCGSTGTIIKTLKNELEKTGNEVFVVCGVNRGADEKNVYEFSSERNIKFFRRLVLFGRPTFSGSPIDTFRFKRLIKKLAPDVVHVHCLNCNCLDMYSALKFLGKKNYKTVITHHAEIYYTGSCEHAYSCQRWVKEECRNCDNVRWATGSKYIESDPHRLWSKLTNAFSSFSEENLYFTAVSPWLKERVASCNHFKKIKCDVVFNGVNTYIFNAEHNDKGDDQIEIPKNYVLHVTAQFNILNEQDLKGGWYVVELAKITPNINYYVVASRHSNLNGLPSNIHFIGSVTDQRLMARLYRDARVTLLTSKRETFSMVCAESLCCGTPVVGFEAGGPESIALTEYTSFVEYGNIEELKDALIYFYNPNAVKEQVSREAFIKYSTSKMARDYYRVYKEITR